MPETLTIYGKNDKMITTRAGEVFKQVYIIIFSVFGLIVGSFLNVCIYRIPLGISVAFGHSHCTFCKKNLRAADLVPVLSYISLKGKCRYCKTPISVRYAVIELLTGLSFVSCYMVFSDNIFAAITACVISSIFIVISAIDIDTFEISNGSIMVLAFAAAWLHIFLGTSIIDSLLGFAVGFVPFLILFLILPNGIGGGDVKLFAACGFLLGPKNIILAILLTYIIATIYVIYKFVAKQAGRKQAVQFAPYIAIGTMISLFFGNKIIDLYLSLWRM